MLSRSGSPNRAGAPIASQLDLSGSFWKWFQHIDISFFGLVIVGMFLVTWTIAVSV